MVLRGPLVVDADDAHEVQRSEVVHLLLILAPRKAKNGLNRWPRHVDLLL